MPLRGHSEHRFRENSRAPVAAPVRLQFDALKEVQECFTANLSIGGMFVAAKSPRPVGTLLRFELDLGTGEPIKGLGEVVWMRPRSLGDEAPSGFGVQFGHLDDSDRERLQAAVLAALEDLGAEGLSTPVPRRPATDRPAGLGSPPSGTGTTETRASHSPAQARSARPPQPKKTTRDQAGGAATTNKKGAQPSRFAMSGRTKVLIVILGLLLLMLLFLS